MSINYTRFSRTDSLIIHGPWVRGGRRLEEKIPKAKKPTTTRVERYFYLFGRLFFFFDKNINEI